MAVKTHYQLLGVAASATTDEVKRAFREQIALYHPDKVHHLGKEFQDMAAEKAAALTEAYRVLSNEALRTQYDQALAASSAPDDKAGSARPGEPSRSTTAPAPARTSDPATKRASSGVFHEERTSRDTFVRRAAIGRFRQALDAAGNCEQTEVAGFDFACVPRSGGFFSRPKGPRLLGRFVASVDGRSVAETWSRAAQWAGGDETCVFLIGSDVAPASELAAAIAEQRHKSARTNAKVTLIPVDARTWDAHIPIDAPGVVKNVLTRLRSGG